MNHAETQQLIALFFGQVAADAYDPLRPSTLLQLSGTLVSQDDIVAALERQSARVSGHPLGAHPQGRQLLLLLQAAAGDLLARFGPMPAPVVLPTGSRVEARSESPVPLRPVVQQTDSATGLEDDAAILIAEHGVVDAHVVQRLSELAAARGMPATAVGQAIRNLAGGVQQVSQSQGSRGSAERNGHTPRVDSSMQNGGSPSRVAGPLIVEDESDALVRRFVLIGGCIFVAVLALLGLAIFLVQSGGAPPAPAPAPVAPVAGMPAPAAGVPDPAVQSPRMTLPRAETEPPGSVPDMGKLLHDLRTIADDLGEKPDEAASRFTQTAGLVCRWWPRADAGQRGALMEALVDCVYRASASDRARDAVCAALTPSASLLPTASGNIKPDDVASVVCQAGVLMRLARERDLPGTVRDWVQNESGRLLGGERPSGSRGFDAGAFMAIRQMPLRLLGDGNGDAAAAAKAFQRWFECAAALTGTSPGAERTLDAIVTDAIEAVMTSGIDVRASRSAFDVLGQLAARLRWRAGDDARLRLLAWFADARVSSAALNVVTAAIVTRSSAEGVDLTMVLPAGATPEQRAVLRDTYAHAWQIPTGVAAGGIAQAWVQAARQLLADSQNPKGPIDALILSARLAKLNEAAVNRQQQQPEAAAQAIARQASGQLIVYFNTGPAVPGGTGNDGEWALRFLTADRSTSGRKDRIRELESRGDQIGPVDAEVLAEVAMATLAPEARADAQKAATRFAGSPAMIHAALKVLPKAARLQTTASMLEALTGRPIGSASGERWFTDARRALVEKLLELLAEVGAQESADRLAAQLAESYSAMAGRQPSPGGYTDEQAGQAARDMAEAVWMVYRTEAQRHAPNPRAPLRLDEIDRRREGRLTVANGLLQQFAAEQVGCAEALAYVVTGESPGRSAAARTVIDEMNAQRRSAKSIFQQILVVEQAVTRLWMLRFGEQES